MRLSLSTFSFSFFKRLCPWKPCGLTCMFVRVCVFVAGDAVCGDDPGGGGGASGGPTHLRLHPRPAPAEPGLQGRAEQAPGGARRARGHRY